MRSTSLTRKTAETDIDLHLDLDGEGASSIETGVGFFDHMLTLFARHGLMDLDLTCNGDTWVDAHHTVEDVGIVLGQAFDKALGDKAGIRRYGFLRLPMDEALIEVALDISGRPFLAYQVEFQEQKTGDFDAGLLEEFLRAFAMNAKITLHVNLIYGKNTHHIIEGVFKALAKALDMATTYDRRIQGVLSTKGVL